ncbi:MAG: hypothetical protein COB66_03560 [Coxiella sp. (in: Bacteria)]|nr:MAG: hypothetical protein COB66_03560 [Coxiella sp. (in: g-proteobacteria)]
MQAILFLGSSQVGAQYTAKAAELLGYRAIFFAKLDDYQGAPRRAIAACEYYEVSTLNLEAIDRAIVQYDLVDQVVGITSLLDETLHLACAIAQKYSFKGPDPALVQLVDKTQVNALIPEFCPPSITLQKSNLDNDTLQQFFEDQKAYAHFILKPGISSGGVGNHVVEYGITAEALHDLMATAPSACDFVVDWTLQPCVAGELYSLEGYVTDGALTFLGCSQRLRHKMKEVGNEFPVDARLSTEIQAHCKQAVTQLVERAQYQNGYFHCEFLIEGAKAYFIDANMGRIAGGSIVEQIALSYESTPDQLLAHVFDLGLFQSAFSQSFRYGSRSMDAMLSIKLTLSDDYDIKQINFPAHSSCHTIKLYPSPLSNIAIITGKACAVLLAVKEVRVQTQHGVIKPHYCLPGEIVER